MYASVTVPRDPLGYGLRVKAPVRLGPLFIHIRRHQAVVNYLLYHVLVQILNFRVTLTALCCRDSGNAVLVSCLCHSV